MPLTDKTKVSLGLVLGVLCAAAPACVALVRSNEAVASSQKALERHDTLLDRYSQEITALKIEQRGQGEAVKRIEQKVDLLVQQIGSSRPR